MNEKVVKVIIDLFKEANVAEYNAELRYSLYELSIAFYAINNLDTKLADDWDLVYMDRLSILSGVECTFHPIFNEKCDLENSFKHGNLPAVLTNAIEVYSSLVAEAVGDPNSETITVISLDEYKELLSKHMDGGE